MSEPSRTVKIQGRVLYLTEDQGDHWREISHTLPPAHAVRFVT